MNDFGNKIRKLRENKRLPLRTVAAFLDIDQAILSKIERGQRKAKKELATRLAAYFNVNEKELLLAWLSDKVLYEIGEDKLAMQALQAAEEKIAYRNFTLTDRESLKKKISNYFKEDERVSKAWVFGSFARGEDKPGSDIDILIEVPAENRFTLFDFADIQFKLQGLLHRKIDLAEKDAIKSFAWETAKNDLILLYES